MQYYTDQFEEKGYIKRVKGSKSPILYIRGINYLKIEKQLEKHIGKKLDHQGWSVVKIPAHIRYHRIGYRFKVKKLATSSPPWQKSWIASGVEYHEFCISLENGGKWDKNIRIREIKGKDSCSIIIWTPEYVCSDSNELRHAVKIKQHQAQKIANWLQKKFGYELSIITEYQDPHLAIPVSKNIAKAIRDAGIRSESFYVDMSGGTGDVETTDLEKGITVLSSLENLPEFTNQIAQKAHSIEHRLVMTETVLKNLTKFSIHTLKVLEKFVSNAEGSLSHVDKKDEEEIGDDIGYV